MIRLTRPSVAELEARLAIVAPDFDYAEVGATASPDALAALAARYTIDCRRFPVGQGRERFERARAALFAWRPFEIPWLELVGAESPVQPGQVVATLTRTAGLWLLNPCRVVYREDAPDRAAFAYGTLPGHVARGEERFTVGFDPVTEAVSFEILAFSRPAVLLTRVGRPWMRRIQRRFAGACAVALMQACEATGID